MGDILDTWTYFVTPVYNIVKEEFLKDISKACDKAVKEEKNRNNIDPIYPAVQASLDLNDKSIINFYQYVVNTAWNLLKSQGYKMDGVSTYFEGAWCQEHYRYSSMDYHIHNDSKMIAFYFMECPKNPPKLTIHDPRPGKIMNDLPEENMSEISMASSIINFTPTPGLLVYTNSWVPHSITRNKSDKPFRFVHMNIGTRPLVTNPVFPDTAEVI